MVKDGGDKEHAVDDAWWWQTGSLTTGTLPHEDLKPVGARGRVTKSVGVSLQDEGICEYYTALGGKADSEQGRRAVWPGSLAMVGAMWTLGWPGVNLLLGQCINGFCPRAKPWAAPRGEAGKSRLRSPALLLSRP